MSRIVDDMLANRQEECFGWLVDYGYPPDVSHVSSLLPTAVSSEACQEKNIYSIFSPS
jgi:hypothetical protein